MTTHARRTTHHEESEWVVDTATGRIVRRESALLFDRVKSALSDGMMHGALMIEPAEADLRVFGPADEPQDVPEPTADRAMRPHEAHPVPDGRTLNGRPLRN